MGRIQVNFKLDKDIAEKIDRRPQASHPDERERWESHHERSYSDLRMRNIYRMCAGSRQKITDYDLTKLDATVA